MDEIKVPSEELIHLVQFGSGGDTRQFNASARRLARRLKRNGGDIGDRILSILAEGTDQTPPTRRAPQTSSSPKTDLLNEQFDQSAPRPSLPKDILAQIDRLILEQNQRRKLEKLGLTPARTGLFIGPPGVGKTMTAHWIAARLKRPLFTLNLAATSSSLFGKTGANLQEALEHAQAQPSVLLLDEFDAIAKGRSEEDIGEAKRVVTVLLQQIDRWPSHSVLIAATNHGELLDRAIWRRFDVRINFPAASIETAQAAAQHAFAEDDDGSLAKLAASLMEGQPLSDVVAVVLSARKRAILFDETLDTALLQSIQDVSGQRSRQDTQKLALALVAAGNSQRKASELTGVSRDTLRKKLKDQVDG
tara:strand:+ start:3263 stop:4348 length:1086 start_codon:yes stop_codon:yes gene_type:complete